MKVRFFEQYPPSQGAELVPGKVDLTPLAGRIVAIIGYGTMGRAHALNLVRSGVSVVVGSRPDSPRGALARSEGMKTWSLPKATAAADVVMLMLPDQVMAQVYRQDIEPHLKPEAALGFAHGFAVAFQQIQPPEGRACFLAAPKGQGDMLLAAHARGAGVPGLLAVTEGSPVETWDLAASYALAVGCLTGGGFVTTFDQECVSDQFGEQAVLCGGVIELVKAAFDIMVAAGYGKENAYFECVHELKLITDLLHRHGIDGMRNMISGTASYGGLTRGPRLIDDKVKEKMRVILGEIESGQFAREFLAGHDDSESGIAALAALEAAGPLAAAGREMLPRLHDISDEPKDK